MSRNIMPMMMAVIAVLVFQFLPLSYAIAGTCTINNAASINITINDQIQLTPSTSLPSSPVVLYSRSFATGNIAFTCNRSTQWESVYSRGYTSTAQNHIFSTEIPGIGIRIKWPESYADTYYVPGTSAACISSCSIAADNIKVEFIHIGSVSEGEQIIPAGEIAKAHFLNDNGTLQFMKISLGSNVVIIPRSCAIYPSANHIDLGSYDKASLASSKVGRVIDFYFHISCPKSSSIGLTFDSTNNVFSSGTGDIGADANSVPGLSIKVSISTLSASLYSPITLKTRTYNFTNVLERNVLMRAQLFVQDSTLFASSGGAGKVSGDLLYTMTIN